MNDYKEKLIYNLLLITNYCVNKKNINLNSDLIKHIWFFLDDYNLKIIKIQKLWKNFIRCNIHVTGNVIISQITESFPVLEPRGALIRQSSMGSDEWCCPWKNGFISPMLPKYRRLKDRINIGTLVTKLYKNRLFAYGYKSAEELNLYPLQTFIY
jgi:hypothetical protein